MCYRRLASIALTLVAACLPAAATAEPAGWPIGIDWVADMRSASRPPSLRRPNAQTGRVAYAGLRLPLGAGESQFRVIAAETIVDDGLLHRSSVGPRIDLSYEVGNHGSFTVALERLDNTHPLDQAALDSVSYSARGLWIQGLGGAFAPEIRVQAELESEVNRRGDDARSGVTASGLAELAIYPTPAWELSLGLSAESTRYRGPDATMDVARSDRYVGVLLAVERELSPISRLRCEAEAGALRSTDIEFDGPQRRVGCTMRIDL